MILKIYSGHECMVEMAIFNIQRAITLRVGKQELRIMCSACCLIVFNICVTFHENMSSSFKVMERTRKWLTDTHTYTEMTKIIYLIAYFITRDMVHVFGMLSHGLTFV